jgi:hypothetical protein
VSPVRYELGFYIPEDAILHSHCRENLKSYMVLMLSIILHAFLFCVISATRPAHLILLNRILWRAVPVAGAQVPVASSLLGANTVPRETQRRF